MMRLLALATYCWAFFVAPVAAQVVVYNPTENIPAVVSTAALTNQTANANQPSTYAVPRSGGYRVSCYIVLTTAATTSSTLPSCTATFTDATTGIATTSAVLDCSGCTGNAVGLHIGGSAIIEAQLGSNIGYTTTNYASSGATPMAYRVAIKIEALQ